MFLDYIYAPWEDLKICTDVATALHFLGEYFDIHCLRWDCVQFLKKDLSCENLHMYYKHAEALHNSTFMNAVEIFVNENLLEIDDLNPIISAASPTLWARALNTRRKESGDESSRPLDWSLHWSRLLSEIGSENFRKMDKNTFDALANEKILPTVAESAALPLCELHDRLHTGESSGLSNVTEELAQGTLLHARCAAALSATWQDIGEDSLEQLQDRKPEFLAHLLVKCLEKAKADLENTRKGLQEARADLFNFEH
ncbi:MAG: hypothetical protein SGILL_010192 [Bacillariaceae sp.]